jgi:hypothetical protein
MGPRVYTPREANGLVPRLDLVFGEMDRVRDRLKHLKTKVDLLEMIWGEEIRAETNPDHREYDHYMEEIEAAKKDYEGVSKKLLDLEAVLKSVEHGLVDFYGVIDGRLVFLCWRRGEKSIEYYHHLEDGFAGRQPIPAEELAR